LGDAEAVDVYGILNELLDLPDKARRLPFNILVGFNHERFGHLVLKIRANLPEDMKRARRLTRDTEKIVGAARDNAKAEVDRGRAESDRVIAEAKAQGERIVRDARDEAARMVEQSEVCRMAEAQAREILHNAEEASADLVRSANDDAAAVRRGANDYARDVLMNMEGMMDKALVTVRRGREALDRAQADGQRE
jgi:cell division septum initiation protein DivIVA